MTVSIVIVNWNAGPALGACLASLDPEVDVVVVDNASTDGSTADAIATRPQTRVTRLEENVGFARGANAGAATCAADVVVFVNPDARVEAGAVDRLVACVGDDPRVGIAGGGLRDEDGSWQPGRARFGVVAHLVLDTGIGRLPDRMRRHPYLVDWVYGTFMAVRREVFEQLGGFDGSFFLYGEDLDLCHRATALGWRVLHVPGALATHGRNLSASRRFGLGRDAAVVLGELRFYERRLGRRVADRYRRGAILKFGLKAALAGMCGRSATAERARRIVAACRDARGVAP
jgi:GT2 family glycosyltransferase